MTDAFHLAPKGQCVCWGIPFEVSDPILIDTKSVSIKLGPVLAPWLVFMHTSDLSPLESNTQGFIPHSRGLGQLAQAVAEYAVEYTDGSQSKTEILRRRQIGAFQSAWGENCLEAVSYLKPRPLPGRKDDIGGPNKAWGLNQQLANAGDFPRLWLNWLWAWENPYPEKKIRQLLIQPRNGRSLVFAVSLGRVSEHPLRWKPRRKALLTLPEDKVFDLKMDSRGLLKQIQLDMGQVISAVARPLYPHQTWEETYNNQLPDIKKHHLLLEYAAHTEAHFHLPNGSPVSVKDLDLQQKIHRLEVIPASGQSIVFRTVDKASGNPIAVKLHAHGVYGEYLPPVNRNRHPNTGWFQDYSVDWSHRGIHHCSYIEGEANLKVPPGDIFVEVSKGFEFQPVRRIIKITPDTREIVIELEKALNWREKGWVSADTHVHFLSPGAALLEGEGEGVNVVNLLASQWGEMFTNVGDFDGQTTWSDRESGGHGEYLVRVGTENRQHVLGHISLLGYQGKMITPLCTGGPDESALGDPVEVLLTEWAIRCKQQDGLVVLPHFPHPRAENAATIITGNVDGVEMTAWGDLYSGIDPYSLSDWYRYLNCGYFVAAVGGTDKMSASTAVGTVRTYAAIDPHEEFTYQSWKEAIRKGHTFVSYGPLLLFEVEGHPPGARLSLSSSGGTVHVTWQAVSATLPMTRVELIINGEIIESAAVNHWRAEGSWKVRLNKSSWIALLIRGCYPGKPEIIAAHSSPVMVQVQGSRFMAAADAITILEQIEGALAFLDTVATRADPKSHKRMLLVLTSAHRRLHNRLHQRGIYHHHAPGGPAGHGHHDP